MSKKKILAGVLVLIVMSAGAYIVFDMNSPVKPPKPGIQVLDPIRDDEASSMIMDGLDISQGGSGEKIWNLKAESANMLREDESILVEMPLLTYFLQNQDGQVAVASRKGVVDQRNNKIRFENQVRSTYEDNVLSTDLLEYDGERRVLHSPDKSVFHNKQMNGSSDTLDWDLDNQILTAAGNVEVHWTMMPKDK